jgi:acyl-CoA thioester hydrolase
MDKKPFVESEVQVRYAETDQMGVVYHAAYFPWLEVGRMALLHHRGKTYGQMEAEGVCLPVVEAHLEYLKPARFEDILVIKTHVKEIHRASVAFAYEVRRKGEEAVLARGHTVHVTTNREGKAIRMPDWVREMLLCKHE